MLAVSNEECPSGESILLELTVSLLSRKDSMSSILLSGPKALKAVVIDEERELSEETTIVKYIEKEMKLEISRSPFAISAPPKEKRLVRSAVWRSSQWTE